MSEYSYTITYVPWPLAASSNAGVHPASRLFPGIFTIDRALTDEGPLKGGGTVEVDYEFVDYFFFNPPAYNPLNPENFRGFSNEGAYDFEDQELFFEYSADSENLYIATGCATCEAESSPPSKWCGKSAATTRSLWNSWQPCWMRCAPAWG